MKRRSTTYHDKPNKEKNDQKNDDKPRDAKTNGGDERASDGVLFDATSERDRLREQTEKQFDAELSSCPYDDNHQTNQSYSTSTSNNQINRNIAIDWTLCSIG